MAAIDNTIKKADMATALDVEMIRNFNQEYDRLADILGIVSPEVVAAGTALYQYTLTGELNNAAGEGSSSGSAYIEGDKVALSKYTLTKEAIGEIPLKPYARLTTAAAILKSGYENAILRTDKKMLQQVRAGIIADFFTFLANGTGEATGTNLQGALAFAAAKLGDTLETNGDAAEDYVYFVNRQDIAGYLANASITTQTVFGMDYLENFLGVSNIFATSKVAKGTLYCTPASNIHFYGVDFSTLDQAGLDYVTMDGGLIGVSHEPEKDRVSTRTDVLTGALMLAEVKDYIVKATISA